MQYITDLIPKSTSNDRRPGYAMNPSTLTIHSTGNLSSTAKNERGWLTNPSNKRTASFHMVVDEVNAIECLPTGLKGIFPNTSKCENAWHSGDGSGATSGNKTSLSIEICESGNREKTLRNAIELTARVLFEKGWGTDRLRQHYDWNRKNCPRILRDTGRWGWFVSEVGKRLNELKGVSVSKPVSPIPETNDRTIKYTVVRGDTLSKIAVKHDTTVATLKADNDLKTDLIRIGQVLKVRSKFINYTVVRGNTLSGIAIKYGTTVSTLKADNGLKSDLIRVGQVLKVRGK